MTQEELADKLELQEIANKLYMHTDAKNWQGLLNEVFTKYLHLDISSLGGGDPKRIAAKELTEMWKSGLEGLDAVHHQAGHYLIDLEGDEAKIYAYAVATHFKEAATKGKTRTFVGSYDLKAERTKEGWRLNQFHYHLKYMDGNVELA